MLYLEDYLEMIEHLPQQLKGRFNEMREMDIVIQQRLEQLDKKSKQFFDECKRYPPNAIPDSIENEFQDIRREYYKTLEEADEKVQLANQMYDLVDKFLRQLDTELHKFKCELEADNKGITEVLEKRSLELDNQVVSPAPTIASQQQKENRFESNSGTFRYSRPPRGEKRKEPSTPLQTAYPEKRQAVAATPLVESSRHSSVTLALAQQQAAPAAMPSQASVPYNLGHIGAGPAIAAAASQAIAATQQMQQGRRTASLKASYEAINSGGHGHGHEYGGIGRDLAGAAQTAIQAIQQDSANHRKKQKRWTTASAGSAAGGGTTVAAVAAAAASGASSSGVHGAVLGGVAPESPSADVAAQQAADAGDGEWTYDPNEPRYCLCNQVSYGDMVACDNEDCPSEWFHYPCVGITAPPKGKWYCPQCTQTMKRRGGRK